MISFDEPSQFYHDNPAIGSGDIRRAIISPQLYRDGLDGLCDIDTTATAFGLGGHVFFLEPAKLGECVAQRPADERGDFRTKAGKGWRDEQQAAGRVILSADDFAALDRMRARMPASVRALFDGAAAEVTVRTKINGLDVQCRPDLWNRGLREWNDLKTIDCADKRSIERAIWSHRYDVQDRWISRVIEAETGEAITRTRFIFAEKNPPYRWRIVGLDREYHDQANYDIDRALETIAACQSCGRWDDIGDVYLTVAPPRWAGGEIAEDESGALNVG